MDIYIQVADLFVLRVAAQKALAEQHRGKLITKSLHAELVYNMSGSRHVSHQGHISSCFCSLSLFHRQSCSQSDDASADI